MNQGSDSLNVPFSANPIPLLPDGLRPSCPVGVGVLDAQHELILEMTRALRERTNSDPERTSLAGPIRELIHQLRMHFLSEETLMRAFGYPETMEHQMQHERMDRVLAEFLEQLSSNRENIVATFLDYLEGWLVRHIVESDQQYAAFFAERGAKP